MLSINKQLCSVLIQWNYEIKTNFWTQYLQVDVDILSKLRKLPGHVIMFREHLSLLS